MRLLQRQLRGARERLVPHLDKTRRRPERRCLDGYELAGSFDDDQAAAISFDYKRINQMDLGRTPATHTTPAVFISRRSFLCSSVMSF